MDSGLLEGFARRLAWTDRARRPLVRALVPGPGVRVLEVGCGPGLLARELASRGAEVVGLEADPHVARLAGLQGVQVRLGRAEDLPFADGEFDVALCHLVLMWIPDPVRALREMRRVVRPGGRVAALAEPDLLARVDYPDPGYAALMARALRARGGHPDAGRRLARWFREAGLRPRLRSSHRLWTARELRSEWEAEWAMWSRELGRQVGEAELRRWEALEREALQGGWRVLLQVFFSAVSPR